jgi:simple sugar transport system ATP-binding protein
MADVFLKLKGIKKSFGGVKALKGVDLEISSGEIHCLAGENGCGKSTLIKVISGVYKPDEGSVFIDGKEVEHLKPIDAIKMGIQVIYQDFAVFPNLSVAENIAMNRIFVEGKKTINWRKSREMAVEAMKEIGAHIDPNILLERLSVANKQIVAICRAIFNDAKLIILDEPTTALTANEIEKLFKVIRNLKEKGIAVMLVNHKMDEIYDIADKLTILRNGQYVSSGRIDEYDRARFIRDLTGRDIVDVKYNPEPSDEVILSVDKLTKKGAFENVSFTLNKGDVFGITGLLGSGRSEIGDALFGISPADSGKIVLNGKEIRINSIDDAIDNRIAYVPEDRLTQGLFLERSILDNTIAASINNYFSKGKLDREAMEEATDKWIDKLAVATPSSEPPISTLSGGNQQKVVIAKWLNTDPKLIVLNGPTVGVDIGSKSEIHSILRELAKQGMGVIIISDDLPELIQNCNKIIVVFEGKVVGLVDNSIDQTTLAHKLSCKEVGSTQADCADGGNQ